MVQPAAPYSTDPYDNGLLTPDEVRDATFPSPRLGRRGVDEEQVRAFCARVADQMSQSLAQRTALSVEVRRLRERMLEPRGDSPAVARDDAQAQAIKVLTSAQKAADKYVAEAQEYSRELAEDARVRHDEILREAQGRAKMILDEAQSSAQAAASGMMPPSGGFGPGGNAGAGGSEAEIVYLRTFSQVCRTHLRAYLDSLSKSIEEWEKVEEQGLAAARGGAPASGVSPASVSPASAGHDSAGHDSASHDSAGHASIAEDGSGLGGTPGMLARRNATGPQNALRDGQFGTGSSNPYPAQDG